MNLSIVVNNRDYYLTKEYLDIASEEDNLHTLDGIDKFTARYTKQDIIDSVRRSNIVADENALNNSYLAIKFQENDKIREYRVYTYDDIDFLTFDAGDFLFKNAYNKNILNQINNHFNSKSYYPESLKLFAKSIKTDSIIQIINNFSSLDYRSYRVIKDYIYNEVVPKMDEKVLVRNNVIKKD